MFPRNQTTYLILFVAIVAVIFSFVNAQDFGFPEETGLSKDKQNARVSIYLTVLISLSAPSRVLWFIHGVKTMIIAPIINSDCEKIT